MSSPRNDKKDATSLDNLIHALEGLTSLLKKDHTLSNAGRILTHLKQLQQTYQSLETHTKEIIDDHLKRNNQELFEALQRKSGSNKQAAAAKVFESGAIIHDSLKKELETISKEHSFVIPMQTTAQPSYQHAVESFSDDATNTTRIHTKRDDADSQYEAALRKTLKQQDPRLYALFKTSGLEAQNKLDPLTACIEALDVLRQGKINKDRIEQQGAHKPNGFDERYDQMLVEQFGVLNRNKSALLEIVLEDTDSKVKLAGIQGTLSQTYNSEPLIKKAAEAITAYIDEHIISSLRKSQGVQHTNTPRLNE